MAQVLEKCSHLAQNETSLTVPKLFFTRSCPFLVVTFCPLAPHRRPRPRKAPQTTHFCPQSSPNFDFSEAFPGMSTCHFPEKRNPVYMTNSTPILWCTGPVSHFFSHVREDAHTTSVTTSQIWHQFCDAHDHFSLRKGPKPTWQIWHQFCDVDDKFNGY